MDPVATRLSNLEAILGALVGTTLSTTVVVISQTGPAAIPVAGGLILITAPGSVAMTLGQPTAAQNGIAISFLSANCVKPWQNSIATAPNGVINPGKPPESFSVLTDSGQPGNLVTLVASGGVWVMTSGFGWAGVGAAT
jgi:hypothetical protein